MKPDQKKPWPNPDWLYRAVLYYGAPITITPQQALKLKEAKRLKKNEVDINGQPVVTSNIATIEQTDEPAPGRMLPAAPEVKPVTGSDGHTLYRWAKRRCSKEEFQRKYRYFYTVLKEDGPDHLIIAVKCCYYPGDPEPNWATEEEAKILEQNHATKKRPQIVKPMTGGSHAK